MTAIQSPNEETLQMSNTAIEQAELDIRLERLKTLSIDDASLTVYVAKTNTDKTKKVRFSDIKELVVSEGMSEDLASYVKGKLDSFEHIIELTHVHTVQDNRFFHVPTVSTDFKDVVHAIPKEQPPKVSRIDELNKYNSYVIRMTFKVGEHYHNLWAFHYFAGAWSAKKTKSTKMDFSFVGGFLKADIDETPVFTITNEVDFIEYNGDLFICNVGKFETATNYQARLKESAKSSVNNLFDSPAMKATDKFKFINTMGEDKHLMRQLASVEEKALYKDPVWLGKLKTAADSAQNWKIDFDENGKIIVKEDKEYIKEILVLLQNKRVMTVVDKKVFDVDGELIPVSIATQSVAVTA